MTTLEKDADALLTFFDFPAEHWKHLLDMAQVRWRRLDGAHLLPLVRAGIAFVDGVHQEQKGRNQTSRAA